MRRLYPFGLLASICFCGLAAAQSLTHPLPLLPGLESLPRLAGDDPVALRLSAGDGGLVMMPDDLAHAVRACGDPLVLTAPVLVGMAASPRLTDALAKAARAAP